MMKKLILTLILGMIMSGPAAPILKSFFGIGSDTAYARNKGDDKGENDAAEDAEMILCPPGGCIQ
jgi:hypothetical protein